MGFQRWHEKKRENTKSMKSQRLIYLTTTSTNKREVPTFQLSKERGPSRSSLSSPRLTEMLNLKLRKQTSWAYNSLHLEMNVMERRCWSPDQRTIRLSWAFKMTLPKDYWKVILEAKLPLLWLITHILSTEIERWRALQLLNILNCQKDLMLYNLVWPSKWKRSQVRALTST